MRAKRRMTGPEFDAIRPLLNISEDRVRGSISAPPRAMFRPPPFALSHLSFSATLPDRLATMRAQRYDALREYAVLQAID